MRITPPNADTLEEVYDKLRKGYSYGKINVFLSDVYYARAAIQAATGIGLTPEQTWVYLYEEGMLPHTEYGIPTHCWNKVKTIWEKKDDDDTNPDESDEED